MSIYILLVILTTYNVVLIVNSNLMYKRYLANNLGICSTQQHKNYMSQKTLDSKPYVHPLQNHHYLNSKGRLLHQMICNDGFQCNTPLKRCCDILLRCFNIIIRILRSRLKIVSSNITLLDLPLALNVFLPTILVKTFGTLRVLGEEM